MSIGTDKEWSRRLLQFGIGFGQWSHVLLSAARPEGLTPVQFEILHYIYTSAHPTFSQTADCIGLSLPNTSREIRKLMELGLVQKRANERDRRVYHLVPSEEGCRLMDEAQERLRALLEERFRHLDEAGRLEVLKAVEVLSNKLLEERTP